MYGVIQEKNPKTKRNDKGSEAKKKTEAKPCPKCGEDFIEMHAYTFNPLFMRNGPKPWSDRKDNNF